MAQQQGGRALSERITAVFFILGDIGLVVRIAAFGSTGRQMAGDKYQLAFRESIRRHLRFYIPAPPLEAAKERSVASRV